jgi:hypothetical protein
VDGAAEWCLALNVTAAGNRYLQNTTDALDFMDELCTALGLKEGEVLRIAEFMLKLWQEHAPVQQGTKRKREDTTRRRTSKRKATIR